MKNEKVVQAINNIIPNENKQEYLFHKIMEKAQTENKINHRRLLKQVIPVAACFIMVLAGVLIYPLWNKSTQAPSNNPSQNQQASEPGDNDSTDIKGLPAEDFSVQNLSLDAAMCRAFAWRCIPNFFKHSRKINGDWGVDSFVLVKVINIQTETPSDYSFRRQVSTVKVLQNIWGKKLTKNFQVVQTNYSGTTIGPTNMLRKKGVYILPLKKYDDSIDIEKLANEEYNIYGDLDVLFEIDDAGLIHSHSEFDDFKWFDGRPYDVLTGAIIHVAKSPDLELMNSNFGNAVLNEKLAQVEIVSDFQKEKEEEAYYGQGDLLYNARISFDLKNTKQREIPVYYTLPDKASVKQNFLRQGSRYLMFGNLGQGYKGREEFSVWWLYAAEIRSDDTIRPLAKKSVFADYSGYTIDEIKSLIKRINAYKTP